MMSAGSETEKNKKVGECEVIPEYSLPPPPPTTKIKLRGQNSNRPKPLKFDKRNGLCPSLVSLEPGDEKVTCQIENCFYGHDVKSYVESTESITCSTCHLYEHLGFCHWGLSCRFRSSHVKEVGPGDWRNLRKEPSSPLPYTSPNFNKDLQRKLRKKSIDFCTVDKIVDEEFNKRGLRENLEKSEPKKVKVDESRPAHEDLFYKKKIDWKNQLYLAPLTTVGNLPFRRICKKFGADITCGEMAMGLNILKGSTPEWALMQRHPSEDLFGVQLCGSNPHQMARVAQIVNEYVDTDFVDINMGCPIDLVYKRGMGAGLMGRKKPLEVIIRSMKRILTVPLTIKIRTGIYADKPLAHSLIPEAIDWGVDLITLHGRSREQRYYRLADWDYIGQCVKLSNKTIPIYGNGDIMDFESYNHHIKYSFVDGVMIARGALIKPWIFTEIKEQRHIDITSNERLDIIKDYANYGLEHWGSDIKGVENTRRFLLEWLSFLHRYVPKGILIHPPQKINERIPYYKGRDQLETLLSSPSCKDWIKVTEFHLGKVPEDFHFEPKHRANSYE